MIPTTNSGARDASVNARRRAKYITPNKKGLG